MITNEILTPAADAAAQRYGIVVEAWRHLFRQAIGRHDFGSPASFQHVHVEAYNMAQTYLQTEKAMIAASFESVANEALQTTFEQLGSDAAPELPDDASELLSEFQTYLAHEIIIQIERDVAFLVHSLRRTYLEVRLAAESQRIPLRAAMIQHQIGSSTELHFFFHDRGNQKWPSRKFIRAVWRMSLLSIYNETVLLCLAQHGHGLAEVSTLSPKAGVSGMLIALGANSEHPTYSEIRSAVFHPNADAILTLPGATDVPAQ